MGGGERICYTLKRVFKVCDLFATTELFRFKGEPYYATWTGSCTSIFVIVIFAVLFASQGWATLNHQIIFVSSNMMGDIDPPPVNVTITPDEPFMFAISIDGLDLNDPNISYFDIVMSQNQLHQGHGLVQQPIPLVKCTEDHWRITEKILGAYNTCEGWKWLCPEIGQVFTVGGKKPSLVSTHLEIKINKCQNKTQCASEAQVLAKQQELHQFRVMVPLVSTMFNPEQQKYHFPGYEDRNEFTFTLSNGVEAEGYIEEVNVQNDDSIWPFGEVRNEHYLSVPQPFRTNFKSTSYDTYVSVKWAKSPLTFICRRTFNKLDEFFAYVGGLIGFIVVLLLFINYFSEKAYGLSLASEVFADEDDKRINSDKFHALYTFPLAIKELFGLCNSCEKTCESTDQYADCIDEMDRQLDVAMILKKLIFFEKSLSLLIPEHQLEAMHLQKRPKMSEAKESRKKYQIAESIIRMSNKGRLQVNGKKDDLVSNDSNRHLVNMPNQFPSGLEPPQPKVNAEIISENYSADTHDEFDRDERSKIKQKILRVMREAERGVSRSRKILEDINTEVLWKLGLTEEQILTIQGFSQSLRVSQSSMPAQKPSPLLQSKTSFKNPLQITLHVHDANKRISPSNN